MKKTIFCIGLLSSLVLGSSFAMEPEPQKPQEESPRVLTPSEQELWSQLKKRLTLLRALKARFAEKKALLSIPAPMPLGFMTQSLIQLRARLGPDNTEDQYISLAMYYPNIASLSLDYQVIMRALGEKFKLLAKTVLDTEKKYWNYAVFYHGQHGALTLIHDIMHAIFTWLNLRNPDEQTRFLRLFTGRAPEYKNVDAFLDPIKDKMLDPFAEDVDFFDHIPVVRNNLLAVNLSLFGNAGYEEESTWHYFVSGTSIHPPVLKDQLLEFFKFFGFSERFIDDILAAHREYLQATTRAIKLKAEGTRPEKVVQINPGILCQIFIHPAVVDELTYLAQLAVLFYHFTKNQHLLRSVNLLLEIYLQY